MVPGLLVAGFGMGVVMAPLVSLVLSNITPQYAAAASGVLSTASQVGNALGVAVIGILFYGVLGNNPTAASYPHAFVPSIELLTGLALLVAILLQLITPRRREAKN